MSLRSKFRLLIAVAAGGMTVLATYWLLGERARLLAYKESEAKSLWSNWAITPARLARSLL